MNKEQEPTQEKELEPIPIDREEFMFNLETTLDFLKDRMFELEGQILHLENVRAKVFKYESMGVGTKFYMKGDELIFQAYRRKPIGFNSVNNEQSAQK